jgi:hypothetical protein
MHAAHVLCSTFDQDPSQAIPTIQALINREQPPSDHMHFSFSKLSKLSQYPLFFYNVCLCFLQLSFLLFFCFVHCSKQPISSSFAEKQQDKTRGILSLFLHLYQPEPTKEKPRKPSPLLLYLSQFANRKEKRNKNLERSLTLIGH